MHKLDSRIFILAFARLFIIVQLHCYLEPHHGLLASTFKVLIGLPLVI